MNFSLGGIFKGGSQGGAPAPATTTVPAVGNNQQGQQQQQQQGQATDPNNQQQQQPADPLQQFQDVWKRPTTANNAGGIDPNNIVGIQPADIEQRLNSAQFAPQITPDVMQAIQNGDVQQLQGILDSTARTTASRVMNAMIGIINKALPEYGTHLSGQFNNTITDQLTRTNMVSNNPVFANPAIKPLADVLTTQFRLANPQATPAQIEQQVTQFFQATGQAFGSQQAQQAQPQGNQYTPPATDNVDWGNWLTQR